MRKKGFTLIELLVVIAIIAMLLAILMPALNKVKKIAQRVVCATNLKGLGSAMAVYANDYDDRYPVQGAGSTVRTWGASTLGWQAALDQWNTSGTMTVSASLYLLVREADVSPKSFVCGASGEKEFDGKNTAVTPPLDIVELRDFGAVPKDCVSYSYHFPYAAGTIATAGTYAANGSRSTAFAVLADKNPWYDSKMTTNATKTVVETDWLGGIVKMNNTFTPYYATGSTTSAGHWSTKVANARAHDRDGQNVTFADGHCSYEKTSDVGIKHDNIYTLRITTTGEDSIRIGVGNPATYKVGTNPQIFSAEDSLLVNDDQAK